MFSYSLYKFNCVYPTPDLVYLLGHSPAGQQRQLASVQIHRQQFEGHSLLIPSI